MKSFQFAMIGGLMLAAMVLEGFAQTGAPPATTQPSNRENSATTQPNQLKIAPGSVIPVELTKGMNSKKAKAGEEVDAKVTGDLRSAQGQLIVPKNTKIVGHVTEVQAHNQEQGAQIAIAFDHAITPTGTSTLPMSIQAIIAPSVLNPQADSAAGNNSAPNGAPPTNSNPGGQPSQAGMGRGGMEQPPSPSGGNMPSEGQSQAKVRPNITGSTQGVLGYSDLKLLAANNAAEGTLITSDKNSVKLESGTLMLLRVNP